ncbi:Uncharacterised protein [Mycolicibacterium vanbaalenii]|uniref:Uncharacterized protein n=1 Tax=Mycolicibacterium vanbaalenii TaxID=110539 RepID=A0A5S9NLS1_MYCVN|nr:Uncharacterised protein [Mycolicibacterium vanbaalenii]
MWSVLYTYMAGRLSGRRSQEGGSAASLYCRESQLE